LFHCSVIFNKIACLHAPPLQNSLSIEILPTQHMVHAPRTDHVPLRVSHKIVLTTTLVQAGVDEASSDPFNFPGSLLPSLSNAGMSPCWTKHRHGISGRISFPIS
jgi:hypothetical protein